MFLAEIMLLQKKGVKEETFCGHVHLGLPNFCRHLLGVFPCRLSGFCGPRVHPPVRRCPQMVIFTQFLNSYEKSEVVIPCFSTVWSIWNEPTNYRTKTKVFAPNRMLMSNQWNVFIPIKVDVWFVCSILVQLVEVAKVPSLSAPQLFCIKVCSNNCLQLIINNYLSFCLKFSKKVPFF